MRLLLILMICSSLHAESIILEKKNTVYVGMAFPVAKDTYCTCYHVVEHGGDIKIDGRAGKLLRVDKKHDIALVSCQTESFLVLDNENKDSRILFVNKTVTEGDSGSPFIVNNIVIGMVRSKSKFNDTDWLAWIVPSVLIKELLDDKN